MKVVNLNLLFLIILIILSILLISCSNQNNFNDVNNKVNNENPVNDESTLSSNCPRGEINDSYPGKCPQYIDQDNNKICDLSE